MSDPFEDFYDEIDNLESAVSRFVHRYRCGRNVGITTEEEFGREWQNGFVAD